MKPENGAFKVVLLLSSKESDKQVQGSLEATFQIGGRVSLDDRINEVFSTCMLDLGKRSIRS